MALLTILCFSTEHKINFVDLACNYKIAHITETIMACNRGLRFPNT